jgi:hypothetical protein
MVEAVAHSIVKHWEGMEEETREFQKQFKLPEDVYEKILEGKREMIGGEEVYLACKQFLEKE